MDNEFLPFPAELVDVKALTKDIKLYQIRFTDKQKQKSFSFKPGQFVEISVAGFGEAPISITSPPSTTEYFELCIKKVGKLTEKIHRMKKGDIVGIRGPYGNGFSIEQLYGFNLIFIAGGIGLAPLRSLIEETFAEREIWQYPDFFGARKPSEIIFKDDLKKWGRRQRYMSLLIGQMRDGMGMLVL